MIYRLYFRKNKDPNEEKFWGIAYKDSEGYWLLFKRPPFGGWDFHHPANKRNAGTMCLSHKRAHGSEAEYWRIEGIDV